MKIAKANPSNNNLIENMIPLWTGREISPSDTVDLLGEYEGNDGKGKILMDVNKKSIIINTKINLSYSFPSKPGTSGLIRLNDVRNGNKLMSRMMTPVIIRNKNSNTSL